MTKKRDLVWDYARGIAIVMIVVHHLYAHFFENSSGHADSLVSLCCSTMQLPVFFYISGMFVQSSMHKYNMSAFILTRLIRLLLPYISFMTIWGFLRPERIGLFCDDFKDGYWFTFVLFEMTAVFVLVIFLSVKYSINDFVLNFLIIIFLSCYMLIVPSSFKINQLLSINLFWHYFPFFLLGVYSRYIQWVFKLDYVPFLLIAFVTSQYFFVRGYRIAVPFCNLSSLLLMICLFKNGFMPFRYGISKIGVFSLQIYLLHFFFREFSACLPVIENPYYEFSFYLILALVIVCFCIIVARQLMRSKILSMMLFGIK